MSIINYTLFRKSQSSFMQSIVYHCHACFSMFLINSFDTRMHFVKSNKKGDGVEKINVPKHAQFITVSPTCPRTWHFKLFSGRHDFLFH